MKKEKNAGGRTAAIIIIIVTLVLSVVFSLYSFTGYVAAEEIHTSANAFALVLFLAGLSGSYFLLKGKR